MSLWFELSVTVARDHLESVQATLLGVAPGGLAVEEPTEILSAERGFAVRESGPVVLHAYVPSTELGAVLIDELRKRLRAFPDVELTARAIYEEDWSVSWREFFGVVATGGRVVVVPSWIEHEPAPGQVVVRIDPGQAFGTGHHETTRLCLLALDEHVRPGISFLDVGTGSGILSLAAIGLGAARGLALDVDPAAVAVAGENLRDAGLANQVELRHGTLESDHDSTYDLVVANIFAEPIIGLAPALARVLVTGGVLITSGILGSDARRVAAALTGAGLVHRAVRYEGDWCALETAHL